MNLKIKTMGYSRVFSLGNYENEKISVDAEIPEGMNPTQAYLELKSVVENAHNLREYARRYNRACEVLASPKMYTGNQVEQAQEEKRKFEAKYPDLTSLATHMLLNNVEEAGTGNDYKYE